MKKTQRRVLQLALIATIASTTYVAAASLGGANTESLGAGSASVQSCDADGVGTSYTVVSDEVTAVVVSGIAATCAGGELSLTLTDSSDAAIASGGPQTVDGTSLSIPVTPNPELAAVAEADIVILGP